MQDFESFFSVNVKLGSLAFLYGSHEVFRGAAFRRQFALAQPFPCNGADLIVRVPEPGDGFLKILHLLLFRSGSSGNCILNYLQLLLRVYGQLVVFFREQIDLGFFLLDLSVCHSFTPIATGRPGL